MSSKNSEAKIAAIQGLTGKNVRFLLDLQDGMTGLRAATEAIKVPVFDQIYNGLVGVVKGVNEVSEELAGAMTNLCTTWGERKGFGAAHEAAFEECKTSVKAITNSTFVVGDVDMSDGLHEDVSEETVSRFVASLTKVVESKDPFIYGVGEIANDYATEDTAGIYNTIGAGLETFTNGIVDVLNAHKKEIAQFGVSLDESINSAKKSASTLADTTKSIKQKIDVDGGLN